MYKDSDKISAGSRSSQEKGEIGRASGILASGTMLSRVLGLVRNQILSHFFGAGLASDAFIAAFTIPNALRRLFGEGGLTPAFVSIFTRSLHSSKEKPEDWQSFLAGVYAWLTLIVGGLCLLGIIFSPFLVMLYVPHFVEIPGKFELTVSLTRVLFPFILLISWIALAMGVLNTFKKFALPAIGPALLNLTVILCVPFVLIFLKPDIEEPIFVYAGAILVGVCIQLLIQVPTLKKLKALPRLKFNWKDPRVRGLGLLLAPAIFSMGIYQLNIIVNRIFASDIPGAVSHLFFADLILELPVSLIATSMSVAAMPSFARLYVEGNRQELGKTFHFSFSLNASLAFPAMFGLLALSLPIISMIFQTGEFNYQDSLISAQALFNFALGLPFFCLIRSLLPLYFAAKDTRTPAYAALVTLLVNFVLAWQLSKTYGAPGIALATAIASAVNFTILASVVAKRFPEFPWMKSLKVVLKSAICALGMGVALYFGLKMINPEVWTQEGIRLDKVLTGLGLVCGGAALYFLLAYAVKIEPLQVIGRQIFNRLKRN